jgi:5-methylcytosine-specific restriction protein A
MPNAAPHACAFPGCPGPAPRGQRHCPDHTHLDKDQRPTAARRGYDRRWTTFSRRYLNNNPMCQHPDCVAAAKVTDHIVPLAAAGPHCDERNSQALCLDHHASKTAAEQRGAIQDWAEKWGTGTLFSLREWRERYG